MTRVVPAAALAAMAVALAGSACAPARERADWPAGYLPVAGAPVDAATGWPTRLRHEPTGIDFILVPAGEFVMGSPADDPDHEAGERPHRRVVRRAFYLGRTEVTTGQFRRFVVATGYRSDAERARPEGEHTRGAFATTADGGREWSGGASWRKPFPNLAAFVLTDDHPALQLSHDDARSFLDFYGMELPTEAQWEYAARAGTSTRFPWGDSAAAVGGYANVLDESAVRRFPAWNGSFPFDDGAALPAPVARYRPNAWGFHDMVGNVAEWTRDGWGRYPDAGADETAAPGDSATGWVLRGGAWLDLPFLCRAAARAGLGSGWRRDFAGFRAAFNPP